MTPVQTLALRVAVLQALMDRVNQTSTAMRRELLTELLADGVEKIGAKLPDGKRVASVSVAGAAGKAKARVADPAALLEWVKRNRPGEVEERVRESYRKALLAEVEETGEIVPGIELHDPTPYLSCRPVSGGKQAIAEAWTSGGLSLPEVLALPAGGDGS